MFMTVYEYNELFRKNDILLKDYRERFKMNSPTFVKINNDLIQIYKVDDKYLNCIIDRFELIPNGGVIYLKGVDYEIN